MMDRFKELMSRRVGGIPVGIIAVVIVGAALVFALRMRGAKTSATDETATEDEPTGDDAGQVYNPVFSASPTTSTVISVASEDTNELWGKRAREWLVAHGSTPSSSQQLISKYLNSDPLTQAEKGTIDQVVAALGFPPEPPDVVDDVPVASDDPVTPDDSTVPTTVPGGGTGAMPPTKQGVPPSHHVVKNARDNGPGELATLYYGSNAPAKVARLEAANWELGAGPWAVGTNVKIPDDHPPVYFKATHDVRGLDQIAAKNGVHKQFVKALNPGKDFPVAVGTQVRVN